MEKSFTQQVAEFAGLALEKAEQAGIAPAEVSVTDSASFSVRVRAGVLEDYKVADKFRLTLRGRVGDRIGTASTQALDEEGMALTAILTTCLKTARL